MSLRTGVKLHYMSLGLRGVLAAATHRLFGVPTLISADVPGNRNAVWLRLRTTDLSVYRSILLGGEYSFDLPFSPKVIVDAGANIGMSSIFLANKYPEASIFAVEAEASNFAMLVKNTKAYPRITPIHAALWNRDGQISVGTRDPKRVRGEEWAFVTREGPGDSVRAVTMRTLMREMSLSTIDIAKIDIEGAEQEVFEDTTWLADVGCVMIELHDNFRPGCAELVEPAMREFSRTQRGETIFFVRVPRTAEGAEINERLADKAEL